MFYAYLYVCFQYIYKFSFIIFIYLILTYLYIRFQYVYTIGATNQYNRLIARQIIQTDNPSF